ncbi:MAG: hypothetical protein QOI07_3929, partial [Verrucomicrobiota bacterium]
VVTELGRCGALPPQKVARTIADLGVDPEKLDPLAL